VARLLVVERSEPTSRLLREGKVGREWAYLPPRGATKAKAFMIWGG